MIDSTRCWNTGIFMKVLTNVQGLLQDLVEQDRDKDAQARTVANSISLTEVSEGEPRELSIWCRNDITWRVIK